MLHGGQGGAEFVADVGGQLGFHLIELAEAGGHAVELAGHHVQLPDRRFLDPVPEAALGVLGDSFQYGFHGPKDEAGGGVKQGAGRQKKGVGLKAEGT